MRTDVAVFYRATHRDPGSPASRVLVTSVVAGCVLANTCVTGTEHTRVLSHEGAPRRLASFPERTPVVIATRCACYRVPRRAAPRRFNARTPRGCTTLRWHASRRGAPRCTDAALNAMLGLRAVTYSLQVHA
jgi:hypothetical protein